MKPSPHPSNVNQNPRGTIEITLDQEGIAAVGGILDGCLVAARAAVKFQNDKCELQILGALNL